jgi:hypothetical protein
LVGTWRTEQAGAAETKAGAAATRPGAMAAPAGVSR